MLEQTGDIVLVIDDPEFLFDHLGDTGARPDLASEPVSLRPMPQELRDQTALGRRQLRGMPRSVMGEQSLGAARASTGKPTAYGLLGHVEGFGDVALIPALLLQLQRAQSPPFAPVIGRKATGYHSAILADKKLDLLCATVSRSHEAAL